MTESAPRRETPPQPTAAERAVADLLPIEADPDAARAVLDRVPLWLHTFSLDHSDELYTPVHPLYDYYVLRGPSITETRTRSFAARTLGAGRSRRLAQIPRLG